MGALTSDWHPASMADSLVAADFLFSRDVLRDIAAQITFDGVVLINEISDTNDFLVSEIADAGCSTDIECFTDVVGSRATDSVDIGE